MTIFSLVRLKGVQTNRFLADNCYRRKANKLNILQLKKQLDLNKTILIHKIYNNQTPTYLTEIITKAPSRYNSNKLIVP